LEHSKSCSKAYKLRKISNINTHLPPLSGTLDLKKCELH
jgi:hypothetical protein